MLKLLSRLVLTPLYPLQDERGQNYTSDVIKDFAFLHQLLLLMNSAVYLRSIIIVYFTNERGLSLSLTIPLALSFR